MSIELGNRHAPLRYFDALDDELLIAGERLSALARRVGSTPFYAYDHTVIDRKIAELRAALPHQVQIHYAVKANPMAQLVKYLRERVDGLDVASAGELSIALRSGCEATAISFAGPGKTVAELTAAVQANITINVESERELVILSDLARATNKRPRIAIRVNPPFELKTSGMKMGGGPKPFGIDAERVPAILLSLRTLPLEFYGLHIFSGSQNLQANAIVDAQNQAFELAVALVAGAPAPLRDLNLGGGFGIPYFPGDQLLALGPIADNLRTLVTRAQNELSGCRLTLELGRYLVGEAGIYVCQVIDRKVSRGHPFLVVDGGLHHHLAASGNFGQVIRKNFPVLVGNRIRSADRESVSVVGPLCTPLDLLADKLQMARADVGDLIVVMQSGAYGLSASPQQFLGHAPPQEIFV
jgi:diaminopimelate decarboxylase